MLLVARILTQDLIVANMKKLKSKHQHGGFSLIEVLVALLILAIGVLGIAALQFKALRYSHDANLRTQISYLASDIADKMRINRNNIGSYAGASADHSVDVTDLGNKTCTITNGASATNDLNCWHNQIDSLLPHGSTAAISVSGSLYTITMGWTDREGETHTVEYTIQ